MYVCLLHHHLSEPGLRAGARLCVVSRRNSINKKFLYDCRSGVKDDRVKMLKVRNKLTVCRRRYNEIMNTKKRVKRNPNQTVR